MRQMNAAAVEALNNYLVTLGQGDCGVRRVEHANAMPCRSTQPDRESRPDSTLDASEEVMSDLAMASAESSPPAHKIMRRSVDPILGAASYALPSVIRVIHGIPCVASVVLGWRSSVTALANLGNENVRRSVNPVPGTASKALPSVIRVIHGIICVASVILGWRPSVTVLANLCSGAVGVTEPKCPPVLLCCMCPPSGYGNDNPIDRPTSAGEGPRG